MTLYEIDKSLYGLIDEETGEIKDFEAFEALQMDREKKIEGMCLWYKNLRAQAESIKAEEKALKERRESYERNMERMLKNISTAVGVGNTFETPRAKVSWKKSTSTKVDADFLEWAKENAPGFLRYREPEAALNEIKAALNNGEKIEHARLEKGLSMSVK